MIPGKKYALDDFLWMAWRRRWLIVLPFLLVSVGTALVAYKLPNRYRSATTILIVPQRVPESYVPSTVTTRIEDRLQMISQQILSRTRLERIVQEFNLYERERKEMIMEDIIEQMRTQDVKVAVNGGQRRRDDASSFTVSFTASDARTAMLVTERLASLFIKENLEDRSVLADATSQFMETQLEDARRRLMEHEKKLEEYRTAHEGSLPSQLQSNLHAIQTTQQQLQALQESVGRDEDRRTALDRQLAALRVEAPLAPVAPATADGAAANQGTAAQRLEAARAGLRLSELRLKPQHPDIQRMKRAIRDLEKEAEAEALQRPLSEADVPQNLSPAELARRTRIVELLGEFNAVNRRLTAAQSEEQRLRGLLAMHQRRVEETPSRESEMVSLMRDYDTLKTIYTDLLTKNEASKVSANLERRQIGEQFRILDGARLPEKPVSPDRVRIISMGAGAGLLLGVLLVALLEYRDTSLKTDDDVVVALALPVLALVPAIVTRAEMRLRRRRRLLVGVASAAGMVALTATLIWKFHVLDSWVR